MRYRELTQAEQEAYNVGYRVGNRQIIITDIEWESETEHKIYRKGYMAGLMDFKRKNVSNVSNVSTHNNVSNVSNVHSYNSYNSDRDVYKDKDVYKVKDKVKVRENNSRKQTSSSSTTRTSKFVPPTLEQVIEYARLQNGFVGVGGFPCTKELAEQFWSHYESIGWCMSNENRTPIVNWQSKLRNWSAKEHKTITTTTRKESEKERKARENHEKLQKMLKGEQI